MPARQPRLVIVRTTVATERQAARMASRLVDAGAACVHLQAVRSFYDWQGKRMDEEEWLVEARVARKGEANVRLVMLEGHPYELPLVESWTTRVNAPYVRWARQRITRK